MDKGKVYTKIYMIMAPAAARMQKNKKRKKTRLIPIF